jgi:phosphonate transport system substrate-binding protein
MRTPEGPEGSRNTAQRPSLSTFTVAIVAAPFGPTPHHWRLRLNSQKHRLPAFLVTFLSLAVVACGGASSTSSTPQEEAAKSSLVMAFVPSQQAQTVLVSAKPIADYVAKEVGVPITAQVPTSYAAVTEAMTSGNVDIAWVGPLDYVIAHEKNGAEPVTKSVRKGVAGYKAFIIARKGSGISGIKDLKGKSFAFGDPVSASSNLYPKYFMKQNGIDPEKDLAKAVNISNQTAIATSVCNGVVDAGAIYDDARTNVGADTACPGIMDKTQIIFETPLIPGDPQMVRHQMNAEQKKKVVDAMVKLGTDPTMAQYLKALFTIEKTVPATDADYNEIRTIVKAVNPSLLTATPAPATPAATPSASPSK